jgi:hypothetical protein
VGQRLRSEQRLAPVALRVVTKADPCGDRGMDTGRQAARVLGDELVVAVVRGNDIRRKRVRQDMEEHEHVGLLDQLVLTAESFRRDLTVDPITYALVVVRPLSRSGTLTA